MSGIELMRVETNGIKLMRVEESGRRRNKKEKKENGKQRKRESMSCFTSICHKIKLFTVIFLGGTFDEKSVLRGRQLLCATLATRRRLKKLMTRFGLFKYLIKYPYSKS